MTIRQSVRFQLALRYPAIAAAIRSAADRLIVRIGEAIAS